ncbi:MAG: hypothetical protein ACSHWU_04265 [Marinicella sp.]
MKNIITLMAMVCPMITLAENSIKDNLRNAERSPLFQQKFSSAQISAKGLDQINLYNGVSLQFKKYTELTRLDQHEKFKPLMNSSTANQYLKTQPTYTENILQLQDRMIVERSMQVSLKNGVCKQQRLPASVSELCFMNSNGQVPVETENYLRNLRHKMDQIPDGSSNTLIIGEYTTAQLRTMNDQELLDALLNSNDREISMVSVLPTKVHNQQTRSNLWNTSRRIKPSNFNSNSNLSKMSGTQYANIPSLNNQSGTRNQIFPKRYFLTGFTIGREITDTFEIQLAPSTPLTDRYFVRFEYEFSAGFGLRFPFSVAVESKATNTLGSTLLHEAQVMQYATATKTTEKPRKGVPRKAAPRKSNKSKARDHRQKISTQPQVAAGDNISTKPKNPITHADITIAVAPVNVNSNGAPAYPAVNLPQSKYFDGKEFVLKFHAGCQFKASIPGDDINLNCPTVDFDKSRDIDPVIGNERARLATLWLNGSVTGLTIEAWAGSASLDFGIESNLTNGRIRLNAYGYNNTLIANQSNHSFLFENKNPQQFKVMNNSNNNAAFNLNTPSYAFDFELRPVARARFDLDLGIKKLKKTLGPYSLDALSLTIGGFSMGHHEGTVASHIYSL